MSTVLPGCSWANAASTAFRSCSNCPLESIPFWQAHKTSAKIDNLDMKCLPYAKQSDSPNRGGQLKNPQFLVIHYTAGKSFDSARTWLCSKAAKASAHVLIGRGGEVAQLVPFDTVAWHAGASTWKGLAGLNKYSIGIELDNDGPAKPIEGGKFRAVATGRVLEPAEVVQGKHKHGGEYEYWVKYPYNQVLMLKSVVADIKKAFPSIREVVGHEDICVPEGRKLDPGPAAYAFMKDL